jgi:hypothetical protein
MEIFQKSVLQKYLTNLNKEQIKQAFAKFKSFYGNQTRIENIRLLKEENYQEGFLREIFVQVLGYTINPNENYDLTTEFKNQTDAKKADGAILKEGNAVGVIELKSTKTKNLESIKEQAFSYKNNQSNCRYVITSNFQKLRFYVDNATEYEEFDLFNLSEEQFEIFYLILNKDSILSDTPLKLKEETKFHEEKISDKFYKNYSEFKANIYNNLIKNNPQYDKLILFKMSQKLLDRLLFTFFAEDTGLVPPNAISRIVEQWQQLKDLEAYQPLYDRFKLFFTHLNEGKKYKTYELPPYNGGLFAPDDVMDSLKIDDEVLNKDSLKLSSFDFSTDVDVNILGHIFEHSISEIEEISAEIKGEQTDKKKSKRKKEGIFYTPKYITQYIVENTIGALCKEKKQQQNIYDIDTAENYRTTSGKLSAKGKELFAKLEDYKKWLLTLKILDPACGSGAFLNQALDFLIKEHQTIDDMIAELLNERLRLFDTDKAILENNLFGVDINEESVEIAKLSLWLRTAKKGRQLSNLSNNIKCGNSLIDDPDVAGDKAFNWNMEFVEIMRNGGFDVVIGNPPYGKYFTSNKKEKYYLLNNQLYGKTGDLSECFINKVIKDIIKDSAHFSFIVPKGLTYVKSWRNVRDKFINDLDLIGLYDVSKAFEDVLYEMVIFHICNTKKVTDILECGYFDANKISVFNFNKKYLSKDIFYVGFPYNYLSLFIKVQENSKPVSNYMDFWYGKGGMTPNVNFECKGIPVLTGKEINKYFQNDIQPKWYLEESFLNDIDKERVVKEKVVVQDIVAHITKPKPHIKLTATIDCNNQFCLNTVMCFSEKKDSLKNSFLLSIINSKFISFFFYYFIFNQAIRTMHFMPGYADTLPIPNQALGSQKPFCEKSKKMLKLNRGLINYQNKFIKRVKSNLEIEKITNKLSSFYHFDFKAFLTELKKQKITISLKQQDEWEDYFNEYKTDINNLQYQIAQTDREIDQMVYQLYGLTPEEIEIVENAV